MPYAIPGLGFVVDKTTGFISYFVLQPGRKCFFDVLKAAGILLILSNIKIFPLAWHFRFLAPIINNFYLHSKPPTRKELFSPYTIRSYAPLYEIDFNLHKSNSTYFSDLDISRGALMSQLTKKTFSVRKGRGDPVMYIAVAGVSCLFWKEIKAYTYYEVTSRVLTWDGTKWLWIVSHFHSPLKGKRGKDGKVVLYASAMSKYCFKEGRKTIKPEDVLRDGGLLPRLPSGWNMPTATTTSITSTQGAESVSVSSRTKAVQEDFQKLLMEVGHGQGDEYWTWARIEQERERGQYLANCMLGLDGLLDEFRTGEEEGLTHIGTFPGVV
ncbi:hypothetical protein BJ508DRAFT_413049 [Ascobolus immersus RN42]|uniref:Thioesterase/thiol ester dehydrase-isomerase n=1 Tax=Ascobolus immersus RN42 TaxID=1160509 RepID=A0A3N4IF00_ASCIM|nr:hypothetical protein BJ508DRAFT_413049 [Ascobolus immersus RN42]